MAKAKNSAAREQESIAAMPASDQNVDKIRDILFGGQMRDYDQRFARLEKTLSEQLERLSSDMQLRIQKLDEFLRSELADLDKRLLTERAERAREREEMQNETLALRRDAEKWVADAAEVAASEARSIRTAAHDQSAELMDLIRQTREQADASLSEETARLTDAKVSRDDLAALFSEVALRLNREFELPEGD